MPNVLLCQKYQKRVKERWALGGTWASLRHHAKISFSNLSDSQTNKTDTLSMPK